MEVRSLRPEEASRAGAVLADASGAVPPQPGNGGPGPAPLDPLGVPWPTGPPVLIGRAEAAVAARGAGTGGAAPAGERNAGDADASGRSGEAAGAADPTRRDDLGDDVLVAVEGDEIVGCAVYGPAPAAVSRLAGSGQLAGITALGVARAARRRGIGEALVRACLLRAGEAGWRSLVVRANSEATGAQRLCERVGFERAPDLDDEAAAGPALLGYRYWLDCAALLADARRRRRTLPGLPSHLQPSTLADAYQVQDRLVAELGGRPVGWKIGAPAATVQRATGVAGPVAGQLLDAYVHRSGVELAGDRFARAPGAEAEIALRLGRELRDGPFTALSVADAVAEILVAIELVESRYADPAAAGTLAVVADNCAACELIVGEPQPFRPGMAPRDLAVRLVVDGAVAAEGQGADVLGGPLHVLAWLAGQLAARGRPLRAGELISTGSCTGITRVRPGQRVEAEVAGLGRAAVVLRRFADPPPGAPWRSGGVADSEPEPL